MRMVIRNDILNLIDFIFKVCTASIPVGELDTSIISVSISIPCIKIAISRITTPVPPIRSEFSDFGPNLDFFEPARYNHLLTIGFTNYIQKHYQKYWYHYFSKIKLCTRFHRFVRIYTPDDFSFKLVT